MLRLNRQMVFTQSLPNALSGAGRIPTRYRSSVDVTAAVEPSISCPLYSVVALPAFATAFAANRVRVAGLDPAALEAELPRGTEVFAADAAVVTIARLYSYLGYAVLLAGTLWSAWTMRANAALVTSAAIRAKTTDDAAPGPVNRRPPASGSR